jgi:hypothetical protein
VESWDVLNCNAKIKFFGVRVEDIFFNDTCNFSALFSMSKVEEKGSELEVILGKSVMEIPVDVGLKNFHSACGHLRDLFGEVKILPADGFSHVEIKFHSEKITDI